MSSKHVLDITDATELDTALAAGLADGARTVLDFWVPWCGSCRSISAVLDHASTETLLESLNVTVIKINVDARPEIAERFGVRGLPTLSYLVGKGANKEPETIKSVTGACDLIKLQASISEAYTAPITAS